MSTTLPYDLFLTPEDHRLILAGPPSKLTGRVGLCNRSNVALVLRHARISDPAGRIAESNRAIAPLVLKPHQERRIMLTLGVDSRTPADEYLVEIEFAGQHRNAVLLVTEKFDLAIHPDSVVILNHPGHAQRREIVVSNTGNVPFIIGDIGHIDLYNDLDRGFDRAARVTLEPWAEGHEIDLPSLAVLKARTAGDRRDDALSIHTAGGNVELVPGETKRVTLELTLKTELPHGSRYRGTAAVLTQNLRVIVVSSGRPIEAEAHRRAGRKPGAAHPAPGAASPILRRKPSARTKGTGQ